MTEDGSGFVGDFRRSLHLLATRPMLIVATATVAGGSNLLRLLERHTGGTASGLLGVLSTAVDVVFLGFVGTQREWFLRDLRLLEAARSTRRHVLPFLRLTALVCAPVLFVALAVFTDAQNHGSSPPHPGWMSIFVIVYAYLLDVLLTFVVPALAVTTSSAVDAWRTGQRVLRQTFPACIPYALLPGLTLGLLVRVLPSRSTLPVVIATALVLPLIALVFKGAILAFYARHESTEIDAGLFRV